MPCYSTVTKTKITDAAKLATALSQLGIKVIRSDALRIDTAVGSFSRQNAANPFDFSGTADQLAPIGRQYAAIVVREWAQRAGMSVTGVEGQKITMQRRR